VKRVELEAITSPQANPPSREPAFLWKFIKASCVYQFGFRTAKTIETIWKNDVFFMHEKTANPQFLPCRPKFGSSISVDHA
jgi:hypothetical protein